MSFSTGPARPDLAALPHLGVGVLFNPALPPFLAEHLDAVDFVEVIPDMFWEDRGTGARPRYLERAGLVAVLEALGARRPLTCHSVGLSIGSAGLFDEAHLAQIAAWHARFGFAWHSDHLSFSRMGVEGHEHHAGVSLAVPYDEEVLDLLVDRVRAVRRAVPGTFLLENNVAYVALPEQDMEEPAFLNALCARGGCGLLLDVHNVYCNAVNHGFDAADFVDALDLAHVVEVHVAGGEELLGMYTDAHSGAVPEPVWELLARVGDQAPNLRAITFEFHESAYDRLGAAGIRAQLERARTVWEARPAAVGSAVG